MINGLELLWLKELIFKNSAVYLKLTEPLWIHSHFVIRELCLCACPQSVQKMLHWIDESFSTTKSAVRFTVRVNNISIHPTFQWPTKVSFLLKENRKLIHVEQSKTEPSCEISLFEWFKWEILQRHGDARIFFEIYS